MSAEMLTLFMFGGLLVGLFMGHPLAFVLGGVAVLGAVLGPGVKVLGTLINNIYGNAMDNYVLVAIPLFVLMARFLNDSGVTEKMFESMRLLLARLHGGLALTVVIVSVLLAATTGIVGASIAVMGMIALVPMLKYSYNKELSTGVIMASGCLGILIPPSIMLILMASYSPVSVGALFAGALVPGVMLGAMYALYVLVICYLKPSYGPPVPAEERADTSTGELLGMLGKYVLPPMALILGVLGSLFTGIATATEASAIGVTIAFVLFLIFGDRKASTCYRTLIEASKTTTMVMLVLVGATAFTGVFSRGGGMQVINDVVMAMPGGTTGALILMLFLVFILGMFLDWTGIVLLSFPIMLPIVDQMGVDMLWFVVMVAVVLQTSFLTPPFGYALFYLKGVAPKGVEIVDLYRAVIPFCALIVLACVLMAIFPSLVTGLPALLLGH
ncbi:TRAP transporter large permease [Halomonas elongata]|uniref:TRAP transporter large permease protein n=2 Tax=Halomonas elongata TaxID=2746 RepID=E1V9Z4_HALED|nr:TRAP transporter large permease subunit [Halomonas elongata]MBW5801925.1 TRAP transporter large permease subunit [Halomonas elongata]RAW06101.1 C4-dicarboxylate ABC transporter [Halomonas elongata]WBF17621.1 TRAP transporter large permease subunit [Halomonas elongata]WPU46460.1 TRAP transporter large permease subunit [Halomonas elongata DSM 2581]WVI71252.1 TRAP transporter large permease subunit [Halomonas elongata]